MSIPKIIHYCWFGNNPKPKSVLECIESWKKYCPDFEIKEWNESNYDISSNLYCKQAYELKKWAFASDYARLDIINNYGGVYLDTDVELIKPIYDLLKYDFFIGRQEGFQVNTGAGFGAVKGHKVLKLMLSDYEKIHFIKPDGSMDLLTCPTRNSECLFNRGLMKDDSFQIVEKVAVFPIEYFSPFNVWTGRLNVTHNTYSIHHCDATWNPDESKKNRFFRFLKYRISDILDFFIHIPNRVLRKLFGKDKYNKFKRSK